MIHNDRQTIQSTFSQPWDLVVIGGGITGAGILRAAASAGLRALLLEAADFSFGTSSRSSKMVHGGFRYLRNHQFNVTYESVSQRQHLLANAPHLVLPLRFLMPYYHRSTGRNLHLGVIIYDLMAPRWDHCAYTSQQVLERAPVRSEGLLGGYEYTDARIDDSRMVLRILNEAQRLQAAAINYTKVIGLLRTRDGRVCGVQVKDQAGSGLWAEIQARVVINAAGPWSDELRAHIGAPPRIRKLRGSHVIFPAARIPLQRAVTLFHPRDNRAMFVLPWETAVIFGTTDIDHNQPTAEPYASNQEIEYILEAARQTFPAFELTQQDAIATFAGLRPIVSSGGKTSPSKESRAHVIWQEAGLLTVTGGKLTTYRIMARQALQAVRPLFPAFSDFKPPSFDPLPEITPPPDLDPIIFPALLGRYGQDTFDMLLAAQPGELETICGAPFIWAELRWAAQTEAVEHLDDLLLRRMRLGLLLPGGGQELLPRVRSIIQPLLGWTDERWYVEEARYLDLWKRYYAPAPSGDHPVVTHAPEDALTQAE
ncbi:MAG: glycerol-3-phosphate dehydrogenase/oxidase [Anaerolineaceae bacterium]|jgi:glycerol-3-phosphate dehydrogenase